MDETAFPILLVDLLRREAPESLGRLDRWWPMVRKAASFIVRNGPVTQQDRWEEDGGYSPFTLAAEIAALLAAADIADLPGTGNNRPHLRDTADAWNDKIERWTYATEGDLAEQLGVEGYYVRIAPPDSDGAASPLQGFVPIKNRPPGQEATRVSHHQPRLAGPGPIRPARADDPRILNTLRAIDALLASRFRKARAGIATTATATANTKRRCLRWHRHRPSLALASRRACPLRNCRRAP